MPVFFYSKTTYMSNITTKEVSLTIFKINKTLGGGFQDKWGCSSRLSSVLFFFFFLRNISGSEPAADSGFKGALDLVYRLGGQKNITVEVNNVLVNKEIHNVFGIIKGITDPGTVHLEDVIQPFNVDYCVIS